MSRFTFSILPLLVFLIAIVACNKKKVDPSCYTQIIEETTYAVDATGALGLSIHGRTRLQCAGICPDGSPCDSILELTNTSMGESVRRVRCACKSNPNPTDCDIMLETIRHEGDTVVTYKKCVSYSGGCPVSSDQCRNMERPGPTDTIRSVDSGRDSLVIKRTIFTCECGNTQ